MSDRECRMFLDISKQEFDFGFFESFLLEYGLQLDVRVAYPESVGDDPYAHVCYYNEEGNFCMCTREEFEVVCKTGHSFLVNWYSADPKVAVISTCIRFEYNMTIFDISLRGSDKELELKLCKIFLQIVFIFAERRQLIGCYVDTRSNYPDYNWHKFFLGKLFRHNGNEDALLHYDCLWNVSETEVIGEYLPPIFGLKLSLVDQLRPTVEWKQMKIIGDVLMIFNPTTAQTYHDTSLKLEDIT